MTENTGAGRATGYDTIHTAPEPEVTYIATATHHRDGHGDGRADDMIRTRCADCVLDAKV